MASFRIYHDVINDYDVQTLTPRRFRKLFLAAMGGEENVFSNWVKKDLGRPLANEWKDIRDRIFARDDYTCRYCGDRGGKLQCDHVLPVSRGGPHTDDNLATACEPCNRSKGAKLLSEWRQ